MPELIDEDLSLILKMKYAFKPVSEDSKEEIIEEVYNKFKDSADVTVQSLVEEINKSKKDEKIRDALVGALISSFEKKYPILKDSGRKEKKVELTEEENKEDK